MSAPSSSGATLLLPELSFRKLQKRELHASSDGRKVNFAILRAAGPYDFTKGSKNPRFFSAHVDHKYRPVGLDSFHLRSIPFGRSSRPLSLRSFLLMKTRLICIYLDFLTLTWNSVPDYRTGGNKFPCSQAVPSSLRSLKSVCLVNIEPFGSIFPLIKYALLYSS